MNTQMNREKAEWRIRYDKWTNYKEMANSIKWIHPLREMSNNPLYVFNVVIITCIPALKWDVFVVNDTACTNTWNNKYCTMDTVRQIWVVHVWISLIVRAAPSNSRPMIQVENISGWSSSRITATRVKSPVEKLSEPQKIAHKSHIFYYEMPIPCRYRSLWCPSTICQ